MDDDRAKWHAACDIYSALDFPVKERAAKLYGDLVNARLKARKGRSTVELDTSDLNQATQIALEEQNKKAAKAYQADIVKDYEDALAGADIVATLESGKCGQ